jgi:hypothetical protein
MPSYRTVISREQLYQLEHYLFRLSELVGSVEFRDETKSDKQKKILYELGYISLTIDIIRQTFQGNNSEQPVVGWPIENPYKEDGYMKVYYFSCIKVAATCTNTNQSKISAVCKKNRPYTGGWKFKYRNDWEENDVPIDYSLDGAPGFDLIKI